MEKNSLDLWIDKLLFIKRESCSTAGYDTKQMECSASHWHNHYVYTANFYLHVSKFRFRHYLSLAPWQQFSSTS